MSAKPLPVLLALFVLLSGCAGADAAGADAAADGGSAIHDGDRVVFIGDSITAQGARGAGGWLALIGDGLRQVRPTAAPVLIGLGGSGSTVGHWQHVEKTSRTEVVTMDDKTIEVGRTLDGKVDVVVVMLGMNDVLSPSMAGTPADLDAWATHYAELIDGLRARSRPRVVALATVTPCSEDPASPKNVALAGMNQRLATLAAANGYRLLPTGAAMYEVLALARAWRPDGHVTGDFVHPNAAGHLAIAVGMLRGLGEDVAASRLLAGQAALYRPQDQQLPTLSTTLRRLAGSPDDALQRFAVTYQWHPAAGAAAGAGEPVVTPLLPAGWQAEPASLAAAQGTFTLSGPLDQARTTITLAARGASGEQRLAFGIPAGWRIACGRGRAAGWVQNSTYDPANDREPGDERLAAGQGLTAPVPCPTGDSGPWTLYVASNDYTGLDHCGSVDLAAVTFFSHSQLAYGARWIHSTRARPVTLELGSQIFAGTFSVGVWLNGHQAYAGKLPGEPGRKASIQTALQPGWNLLLFKSGFIQWQWQFSIDLAGAPGDDLDDLRYATFPPAVPHP